MTDAYINRIAVAVPPHDIHAKFVAFAPGMLSDARRRALFTRMAERSQIAHRYSFLPPGEEDGQLDAVAFYRRGAFPDTQARMRFFEDHAFGLAQQALDQLDGDRLREEVTHLIVTCCTGFYAPGLDVQIVRHYGLRPSVERTMVGFMGCYAAMNALKLARHIVRSEPGATVLVVNLELCTLHLQDRDDLEQLLSFLLFADGCAASLVSARPQGIALQSFHSALLPDSDRQITWQIGRLGFDMLLSGQVPGSIAARLPSQLGAILGGTPADAITHWAVHPGGRSILDAVEDSIGLPPAALAPSRDILRRYGNMSSATVMFVLQAMMAQGGTGQGCALAFGPGLTAESLRFQLAA